MSITSKDLASSPDFDVFDGTAIGAGINLITARPGYSASSSNGPESPSFTTNAQKLPRLIMFSGGDLDVVNGAGDTDTLDEATFGGKLLPLAPAAIADSSTATVLLVAW